MQKAPQLSYLGRNDYRPLRRRCIHAVEGHRDFDTPASKPAELPTKIRSATESGAMSAGSERNSSQTGSPAAVIFNGVFPSLTTCTHAIVRPGRFMTPNFTAVCLSRNVPIRNGYSA